MKMKTEEEIRRIQECLSKKVENKSTFDFLHYEERIWIKVLSWVLEDES